MVATLARAATTGDAVATAGTTMAATAAQPGLEAAAAGCVASLLSPPHAAHSSPPRAAVVARLVRARGLATRSCGCFGVEPLHAQQNRLAIR